MEILSSLGVEWKLLLAQIINFGILVFVLYRLVYKPLLKVLDERRFSVDEAIKKSSSIDSKLEEIKNLEQTTLSEARKAGEKIIRDTEASATNLRARLEKEASESASKIIHEAETRIKNQEEKIREEIKREIRIIVAQAIEHTVGKYLNSDSIKRLNEEASEEILKIEKVVTK